MVVLCVSIVLRYCKGVFCGGRKYCIEGILKRDCF